MELDFDDLSKELREAVIEAEEPVEAVYVDGNARYEIAMDEDRKVRDTIKIYASHVA
jgi:hypothetical protein